MSASGPPPGDLASGNTPAGTPHAASGKSPNPAAGVVGRERELEAIHDLLERARGGRSGVLLLLGEEGVGTTTLLRAARATATGFTCLEARGVASESVLAHAALLELLTPVRHLLDDVPAGQAEALRAALGWGPAGSGADRFLVGAATLSLLAAAAAAGPVLVLVDDLHWVDRESASAVVFAARRLGPDAVAFVLTGREDRVPRDLSDGLPLVEVPGLSPTDAGRLIPPDVASPVADLLVAGTAGNPLAVIEVSRRLTRAQRVGAAPLPDPLPVGTRLQTVFETSLTGLSPQAWQAVLLLALDSVGSTGVTPGTAVDEAVEHGVLVVDEGAPRFRHPLMRSAVLRLATPAQQREAHRTLATSGSVSAAARTWHLAGASSGLDDELADALERMADRDRVRMGFAAASAALERSAVLTRDPDRASERLAAAAEDAFVAGDRERTERLVGRVLVGPGSDLARGRGLFTLGMVEQYAGSVPLGVDHLTAACALLDGDLLVRALTEQALARFRLNDLLGLAECAAAVEAAADQDDPGQRLSLLFLGGVARVLAGDFDAAVPMLDEVAPLALSEDLRHDPGCLLLMALAAGFSGSVAEAIDRGAARVDDVRRRGALGVLVPLLTVVAAGRSWTGDHARAYAEAGEAAELAEHLGYAADASVAWELVAWQCAARGRHDDAGRALDRAAALLERAGTTSAAAHHALAAAFCALCRGDLAEVVSVLEARILVDGGVGEMGEPLGVAPLLVEAYVGLGRDDDARELAQRYGEVTAASAPAAAAALVLRCRGLTTPDPAASLEAFEGALLAHAVTADPFEAARTRLLHGSRLRRDGQRVTGREQLRLAHQAFAGMGLDHWTAVARAELAATGAVTRRRGAGTDEPLTSQETRVALLVAEGRTNKEVAAALFLSPKTIERHLGNVFRKRGFSSRAELAGAFARAALHPDPSTPGDPAPEA